MKEDEEFCKDIFNNYLINKLHLQPKNWRKGENPPDYYFTLSGKDYAVEVTTIMMQVTSEPKRLSQQSFQLALSRLSKNIEKIAKEQNILSGCYCLSYDDTFDNFGQASKLIKKSALDYIKNTMEDNEAPWKIIFREGRPKCSIQKASNVLNMIITAISSPKYITPKEGIVPKACQLMQKCLMNKIKKLGKINLPKILILNDSYLFSDHYIYKKCQLDNEMLEFYHSIFIVERKGNFYFIHSEEKSWI
jgi:hypothetical protein